MNLRKLNRVIHRDLSYFFAGMVIIYSISGIALNHMHQWNPNYIITKTEISTNIPSDKSQIDKELLNTILKEHNEKELLSFYYPKADIVKAFVKNGTLTINIKNGNGVLETLQRRPFFAQINFLHYNNPRQWWTAFSDIFAVSLIVITITGLFIIKGRNGIRQRGIILLLAGLILPLVALFLFFK
jgi:uncharacterized protein